MNAINSAVRYGLVNLKTVHDALSVGLTSSHADSASITAPNTPAVIK